MRMFHVKLPQPQTYKNRSDRTSAKKALALEMGLSIKSIERLKLCDKPLETVIKKEIKAEKSLKHKEKCKKYAEMAVAGHISVQKAAKECGITKRQVNRHIAKIHEERRCSETR